MTIEEEGKPDLPAIPLVLYYKEGGHNPPLRRDFMADIRLQRMAQLLVHYSLGIKKGDRLGIRILT